MDPETFRWKPNPLLVALATLGCLIFLGLFLVLGPLVGGPPVFVLGVVGLAFLVRRAPGVESHVLVADPIGLVLRRGGRARWYLRWSDLLEARHERGSSLKNWDRLVLVTSWGERTLILDDRLAGRWSDSARILALLRERGYDV